MSYWTLPLALQHLGTDQYKTCHNQCLEAAEQNSSLRPYRDKKRLGKEKIRNAAMGNRTTAEELRHRQNGTTNDAFH